ncbi:hypothetical protein BH11BAC7_BH11BAC7_12830 [soil metagenome]
MKGEKRQMKESAVAEGRRDGKKMGRTTEMGRGAEKKGDGGRNPPPRRDAGRKMEPGKEMNY